MKTQGRARGILAALALLLCAAEPVAAAEESLGALIAPLLAENPSKTGAYVLEKGEQSLLARAWLVDHAATSIEIQYFIWSNDNIGTLAAEALLRAAERGVRVRVIVDDLLIDAPSEFMLAMALHPNIEILIYNPVQSVGTGKIERVTNAVTRFRAVNQRMHDKTLIVDGLAAVIGGRNMADEYYDYDHAYNFRDRDVLLLGPVADDSRASFERFWQSELTIPVELLLEDELEGLTPARTAAVYAELHAYARNPENFAPKVREALERLPEKFPKVVETLEWSKPEFLSDAPGKSEAGFFLPRGGRTGERLAQLVASAKKRVVIQTPYLVMPGGALEMFGELTKRGVEVRISTNSLASTDNLPAYSGYSRQKYRILGAGIEVREFRPDPAIQKELIDRYEELEKEVPIFALHAKTLVIDGEQLFIGTFNLDPRSTNLNTEIGVLIRSKKLARQVETAIERDMLPGNSWNPRTENPNRKASLWKRLRLQFWELMPIEELL
ncbi:MAG: phospholipase D family protein [Chrysiogenetes bacterium]|nr:phospholipase D family protein [Chrysiogenetes bacterium]